MHLSGDRLALDIVGGFEADFLLSILNASQDCVKLVEPDGALTFMNENGMCAMEIDTFESVAGRPWPELWPEHMRPRLHAALATARNGERVAFEAEGMTAKGSVRWWHVSVLPLRDADGTVKKLLASSRDITERVLREREQRAYAAMLEKNLQEKSDLLAQRDFLMREVDHRVKNSLAQVAAILRLQARRSTEAVRTALDEAARRVASIARVHEQLQSSADLKSISTVPLLQRLCSEFTLVFDRPVIFTAATRDDLPMLSERASALCIILSELVTNAVRHGLPAHPIRVELIQTDSGCKLLVRNAAAGSWQVVETEAPGLGTLICETYAATLSGTVDRQFASGEMTATLEFALSL